MSSGNSRRRWLVVGLIFLVAVINYFDRQSLPVVAPQLQAQLHLSDQGYAHIISVFLGASAIAYALAGLLCDALGARLAMVLFVGFWSLAEAATAFVGSAFTLGLARLCLGLGEPGLWVVAPKAVGETFPKQERSLAIGIYTMGATVGAVIALPLIHVLVSHLPWRSVFLVDGAAGLLWIPFWLLFYRNAPAKLGARPDAIQTPSLVPSATMSAVLCRSATWRLILARGITDPVWYFYLFWFPKYLTTARHMTAEQIAAQGWTVYLFAGLGTLAGGLLSRQLMRKGVSEILSYRFTMTAAALLLPLSPICALVSLNSLAVAISCIIAFAHMTWLVTLTALIVRLYVPDEVGKAAGLIACGSGIGGLLSSEAIGAVIGHHGYTPIFFIMAVLHPLALGLLWRVFSRNGGRLSF